MKKLFIALVLAIPMMAQTTLTYTAPTGSVRCYNRPGQLPGVNHGCVIGGLVGATGTQTASFQTQGLQDGSDYVVYRIVPGVPPNIEAVEANGRWSPVPVIPPAGVPILFNFDGTISNVCLAICTPASGTFNLQGEWSWQYITIRQCGRTCFMVTYQEWTNTTPVVVTIVDQSTVAILD